MRTDIICGLDIGTSSVRALVMQASDGKILGFSSSPTKGFSKGIVSNLNLLSDAIEDAIRKAESSGRTSVRKVISNVSGAHIRTFKSHGSVHISDKPSEITSQDVKRCIDSAKLIAMSLDREVIHLIPERFFIDDKLEIDDPLSLFGSKLDVDLSIITSLGSVLQNLTKAINMAGYEAEELITSASGTALAIFDRVKLEEGAVIIDMGKDLTEAALFMKGKLCEVFYFPFGSDDLTQTLQDRFKIMFKEAEDLRIKYGIVTKDTEDFYDQTQILMPSLKNENVVVSRQEISNILFPKVEQIMQDVYKMIEPFLKRQKSLPHIAVVGGISRMDGFVETVEEIFSAPLEMGRIVNAADFNDTNFACALGLARYGARKFVERKTGRILGSEKIIGGFVDKIRALFSEYF